MTPASSTPSPTPPYSSPPHSYFTLPEEELAGFSGLPKPSPVDASVFCGTHRFTRSRHRKPKEGVSRSAPPSALISPISPLPTLNQRFEMLLSSPGPTQPRQVAASSTPATNTPFTYNSPTPSRPTLNQRFEIVASSTSTRCRGQSPPEDESSSAP